MGKYIFERMLAGGVIQNSEPQFYEVFEQLTATKKLSIALYLASDPDETREIVGKIIGKVVDGTSTVFISFHTSFVKFITIAKKCS